MSNRATELRKGDVILKDGDLLLITDYHHHTPGNLRSIIQMKTKSLTSGQANSLRAGSGDSFEKAYLDRKKAEYLYKEANGDHVFMDSESYEQFVITAEFAEAYMGYVRENTTVEVTFHESSPIGIALPPQVVLKVVESEVAVKGNTANNVKKDAVLETGLKIKVPMHIGVGEEVKVKTENGELQRRRRYWTLKTNFGSG